MGLDVNDTARSEHRLGGASIDLDTRYAITNVVNMPTMVQVPRRRMP